eukprot:TRINITY_DN30409_c0_g1_i1.p4 TRINITY_DN30409_c0_g1~~TRINITY_DN30409_c0_g1_i1.p4  ORF type:complete len:237 (-),score=-19.69 TRINITY_DN30409_c0_g1_i1:411-1121(-)
MKGKCGCASFPQETFSGQSQQCQKTELISSIGFQPGRPHPFQEPGCPFFWLRMSPEIFKQCPDKITDLTGSQAGRDLFTLTGFKSAVPSKEYGPALCGAHDTDIPDTALSTAARASGMMSQCNILNDLCAYEQISYGSRTVGDTQCKRIQTQQPAMSKNPMNRTNPPPCTPVPAASSTKRSRIPPATGKPARLPKNSGTPAAADPERKQLRHVSGAATDPGATSHTFFIHSPEAMP